jgi:hypothetical protein
MCVDQPDFMRKVLLTKFLTHIHQRKSRTMQQVLQGFGTIYIEGHRRVLEITTDILNIVSNNCKYGSCGFCFDFSFHLVFTLNVTRFCGCVFKVFFDYFIQSKLLSLLFLNRFCGYSCFDLLELSEASRSGWNQVKVDFMNLKCLTTFSVYSLPEDPGDLRL